MKKRNAGFQILKRKELPDQCILVSDTHVDCKFAVCDCNKTIQCDEGDDYGPNAIQKYIHDEIWEPAWNQWVPEATHKRPYYIIHLGDCIDGRHHGTTTLVSQNISDQKRHAVQLLAPKLKKATHYFHLRGTSAHSGEAGEWENDLAKMLGATPNELGNYARYDLWSRVGDGLIHAMHHIGTTSALRNKTTPIQNEIEQELAQAALMNYEPPDVVCRGHAHSYAETKTASMRGRISGVVVPSWQGKGSYAWRGAGMRTSQPWMGLVYVGWNKHEGTYTRAFLKPLFNTSTVNEAETHQSVVKNHNIESE